jgi:hypothetical protein
MSISLDELLGLVGPLDDSPGDDTPRERFRRYLKSNVKEVGQVRDYIEGCLRRSGDQYNRALQDLVNFTGRLLGFDVTFGRYRGVQGQIGFDGYWKSPAKFHIVVEVKTTEAYAIKTATLLNYRNKLISDGTIPDQDSAIGLYVIGKPDPEVRNLENAILGEKITQQLRIISVDSLLSLAEMRSEFGMSDEDVLAILRPSRPTIDSVVDLMGRLVAQRQPEEPTHQPAPVEAEPSEGRSSYWLTPVKSDEEESAEDCIEDLVGKEGIYALGEFAPGKRGLKPGDWICFYATAKGVVAHAKVASSPERKPHERVCHPEKFPWTFRLERIALYLDKPVVIDAGTRRRLDAFKGRDLDRPWSWFVQATHRITEQDFKTLTRS